MTTNAAGRVPALRLAVGIAHLYLGDLSVTLISPSGARARVHHRNGGARIDLHRQWTRINTPSLAALAWQAAAGSWRLQLRDLARADGGMLRAWQLALITS